MSDKLVYPAHTLHLSAAASNPDGSCNVLQTAKSHVRVTFNGLTDELDFYNWLVLYHHKDGSWDVFVCLDPKAPEGEYSFVASVYAKDGRTLLNSDIGTFTAVPVKDRELKKYYFPDQSNRGEGIHVPLAVIEKRFDICKGCDANHDGTCMECGCLINNKAWILDDACPRGLWERVDG